MSMVMRVRGGEDLRILAVEGEHRDGLLRVVILRVRTRVPRRPADYDELHGRRQPELARVAQSRVLGSSAGSPVRTTAARVRRLRARCGFGGPHLALPDVSRLARGRMLHVMVVRRGVRRVSPGSDDGLGKIRSKAHPIVHRRLSSPTRDGARKNHHDERRDDVDVQETREMKHPRRR